MSEGELPDEGSAPAPGPESLRPLPPPAPLPAPHPRPSPRMSLWARWTLGTVAGGAVGQALATWLHGIATRSIPSPMHDLEHAVLMLVLFVVGTVHGAAFGTGQWFAVHRRWDRLAPAPWIYGTALASGLGGVLAAASGPSATDLETRAFASMLAGLFVGLGQGRLLRRVLAQPLPWVSASTFAWFLGGALTAWWLKAQPELATDLGILTFAALRGAAGAAVAGALSGAVLVGFARGK